MRPSWVSDVTVPSPKTCREIPQPPGPRSPAGRFLFIPPAPASASFPGMNCSSPHEIRNFQDFLLQFHGAALSIYKTSLHLFSLVNRVHLLSHNSGVFFPESVPAAPQQAPLPPLTQVFSLGSRVPAGVQRAADAGQFVASLPAECSVLTSRLLSV